MAATTNAHATDALAGPRAAGHEGCPEEQAAACPGLWGLDHRWAAARLGATCLHYLVCLRLASQVSCSWCQATGATHHAAEGWIDSTEEKHPYTWRLESMLRDKLAPKGVSVQVTNGGEPACRAVRASAAFARQPSAHTGLHRHHDRGMFGCPALSSCAQGRLITLPHNMCVRMCAHTSARGNTRKVHNSNMNARRLARPPGVGSAGVLDRLNDAMLSQLKAARDAGKPYHFVVFLAGINDILLQ